MLDVNVKGAWLCARAVAPAMRRQRTRQDRERLVDDGADRAARVRALRRVEGGHRRPDARARPRARPGRDLRQHADPRLHRLRSRLRQPAAGHGADRSPRSGSSPGSRRPTTWSAHFSSSSGRAPTSSRARTSGSTAAAPSTRRMRGLRPGRTGGAAETNRSYRSRAGSVLHAWWGRAPQRRNISTFAHFKKGQHGRHAADAPPTRRAGGRTESRRACAWPARRASAALLAVKPSFRRTPNRRRRTGVGRPQQLLPPRADCVRALAALHLAAGLARVHRDSGC